MTWIIIVLVLCLIIGPMLVLLPSPRQKEQIAFRRIAMERGLSVSLKSVDDPDPDLNDYRSALGKPLRPVIKGIAYQTARQRPQDWRRTPRISWKLVKGPAQQDNQLPPEWSWKDTDIEALPANLYKALVTGVKNLPGDVITLDEDRYLVSLFWREKGGKEALERVCEFLEFISDVGNDSEIENNQSNL